MKTNAAHPPPDDLGNRNNPALSLAHKREIQNESGIAKQVAVQRGYRSVTEQQDLVGAGYKPSIARKVVPGLLIPLYSPTGDLLGSTFKPEAPRIDRRRGKPVKYEKPSGSRNVVDCHPSLSSDLSDASIDLWITEGTKKADSAVSNGLCCVALSGVDNWVCKLSKGEDSIPCPEWDEIALRDRRVYVVFDSDQDTNLNVQRARRQLTEFLVQQGSREVLWVDLPQPDYDSKVGLDDYFVAGGTADDLRSIAYVPTMDKSKKPSLSKTVVDYARNEYELFATPQGQAFAVPRKGVRRPIPFPETGGRLTADIRLRLHEAGTTVGKATVSDAMGIVHELAMRGERAALHIRCASLPDQIVIDMGEPDSTRCLIVTGSGWSLSEEPPAGVYFRRSGTTLALPSPQRDRKAGEGWRALADILGWERTSREFLLTRSWIVCAPLSHLQRPMLILIGSPGSGKTNRGLAIIGVWDPREGLGSSLGKNIDDDRVKANSSFLIGYDNLSAISEAQSDHLSRVVTGDSPDKRQLYSDDTIHSMFYRRTGVLTAINMPTGLKADGYERFIPLELNRLKDFGSEHLLKERQSQAHPLVLADALDDLVRVLSRIDNLYRDEPSGNDRMKDYWLALKALGNKYAKAFADHSREGMAEIAQNDPWIQSVVAWIKALPKGYFKGSPEAGYTAYMEFTFKAWDDKSAVNRIYDVGRQPRNAPALARAMHSNATPLRAAGVEFTTRKSNGKRIWEISRIDSSER